MSFSELVKMFLAIGYINEQRCINLSNLKNYMEKTISYDEKNDNLEMVINDMIQSGWVSRIPNFEYLLRINNSIPYLNLLSKSEDSLTIITDYFYGFINYNFIQDKDSFSNSELNIEKVYKKKKSV